MFTFLVLLKKLIIVVTVTISKLFKILKRYSEKLCRFKAVFRLGSSQMSRQVGSVSVALTQMIVHLLSVGAIHT